MELNDAFGQEIEHHRNVRNLIDAIFYNYQYVINRQVALMFFFFFIPFIV